MSYPVSEYNSVDSIGNISFHSINPSNLSDSDLWEIYNIEQDMWAREEWLWEYLKCATCSTIYSKQDVYWDLSKLEYLLTVSELEEKWYEGLCYCETCWWRLLHSFPKEKYIEELKERYASRATLMLMKRWKEFIGFMDGYVESFEVIYNRELADHYWKISVRKVREMVSESLHGIMPDNFFCCSSSWTRERYMNMVHIFNLLQKFYENFPSDMKDVTAISELHAWWPYARIFALLWARSIGIRKNFWNYIDTWDTYKSDIYVHEYHWAKCQKAFSWVTRKQFLKSLK